MIYDNKRGGRPERVCRLFAVKLREYDVFQAPNPLIGGSLLCQLRKEG